MKKLTVLAIAALMALCLAGCNAEPEEPKWQYEGMDAGQIVEAFKAEGLPVDEVQVYDEETDPNDLLGRPESYSSKASFIDTRVEDEYGLSIGDDGLVNADYGGTVEVFETEDLCVERETYLNNITSITGIGDMYMYRYENVLLRIGYKLTPSEAADYEAAFFGDAASEE